MGTYNKIMEWFWLCVGIGIIIGVTILGFKEGFERWFYYYFLAFLALGTFMMRRWMRRRMEKHLAWMEEQKRLEQEQPQPEQ